MILEGGEQMDASGSPKLAEDYHIYIILKDGRSYKMHPIWRNAINF